MNDKPDIIIGGPAQDVLPGAPLALVPPAGHAEDLPMAEPLDVPQIVQDEPPVAEQILSPVPMGGSPTIVLDADEIDLLIQDGQKTVQEWGEDVEEAKAELRRRETEYGKAVGHVQVLNQLRTMHASGSPVVIGVAQV